MATCIDRSLRGAGSAPLPPFMMERLQLECSSATMRDGNIQCGVVDDGYKLSFLRGVIAYPCI